jgi:hypothetical protein
MPKRLKKPVRHPQGKKDYSAFSADELLSALEQAGRSPRPALMRVVLERSAELIPGLVRFLEQGVDPTWKQSDPRTHRQAHAAYLLLGLREPASIPFWERIFRDPAREDMVLDFCFVLGGYGPLITQSMLDLLHDPEVADLPKRTAIWILTDIAFHYSQERERILRVLRGLLPSLRPDGALETSKAASPEQIIFWSHVVEALGDLRDEDSRAQIEAMYQAKQLDTEITGGLYRYWSKFGRYAIPPMAAGTRPFNVRRFFDLEPSEPETGAVEILPPEPAGESGAPADFGSMSPDDLLDALEHAGRHPSPELLRACLAKRAELTPSLLEMLAAGTDEEWHDDDPRWYREIHAGHLLAAFRELRALPIFAEIYRDKENDVLLEWFETLPAEFGPAAVPMALDLLHDREAPSYGRSISTEILTDVAIHYPAEREHILSELRAFLPPLGEDGAPILPPDASDEEAEMWTWAALALADLRDKVSRPQVQTLFEREVIGFGIASLEDYFHAFQEDARPSLAESRKPFDLLELYADLAERDARWPTTSDKSEAAEWDEEDGEDDLDEGDEEDGLDEEDAPGVTATPWERPGPKVGRNALCPCGSGRKYKHCCGKKKTQ